MKTADVKVMQRHAETQVLQLQSKARVAGNPSEPGDRMRVTGCLSPHVTLRSRLGLP